MHVFLGRNVIFMSYVYSPNCVEICTIFVLLSLFYCEALLVFLSMNVLYK